MPYLNCKLSVEMSDKQRAALLPLLSKALSEPSGKAERYCMVSIDQAAMCLAGVVGPTAFVDIRGIGGLTAAANKKISEAVCSVLKNELSIPPDRVYLNFTDIAGENWGHNSTTFG